MTFEKQCVQLLELYDNTGKEFYQELIALVAGYYPGMEHTIMECSGTNEWKIRATTIRDPDETEILLHMAEQEVVSAKRSSLQFSAVRKNIKGHVIIPLSIRYRKMIGIWIIESRWKEKVMTDKEMMSLSKLIALFLQALADEKCSTLNRYIDAKTGLLGKQYFSQVAERINKQDQKVLLCAVRWHGYRELVREKGSVEAENCFHKLMQKVKDLELGNCYLLAEDTLSFLTTESEPELYARVETLLEEPGMGRNLKIILMEMERNSGLFSHLEERFSLCNPGIIWRKESNPITKIFMTEQLEPGPVTDDGERNPEEVVDELLEMLERKYDV